MLGRNIRTSGTSCLLLASETRRSRHSSWPSQRHRYDGAPGSPQEVQDQGGLPEQEEVEAGGQEQDQVEAGLVDRVGGIGRGNWERCWMGRRGH